MPLSARNQLKGIVVSVKEGAVMAEVVVRLGDGSELVSVITVESARRLQLAQGSEVTAVIKSTSVMLATDAGILG
jgi:molybdopterin-binding protein